ncbi:MAG TPA: DNA internalization-related competence protein ComEC/Rec2 [Castellaniella sp.]|uniref:DNA internalization-related competence protein ComEC/Rec2 n=1 Tax=Castellaniella sp. TaxID=1955812 RepID=UPI002F01637B
MLGRGLVVSGVLGVVAAHHLRSLPSPWVVGLGLLVVVACGALGSWCARIRPHVAWQWLLGLPMAACAGFAVTVLCAQHRLAQGLDDGNVDRVSRVVLRIESLPKLQPDRVSFVARVLQAHPSGVPDVIRVSWPASGWRSPYSEARAANPPFPTLHAGQVWRMALVLRPVQAAQNLHAFDYERHVFAAGIRAQATVRGQPELLEIQPWHSLSIVAERARHEVRVAMAPYLEGLRYGAVLRALAIGDQDGVDDADWQVFNRSGLTHLVSISGSHITMLAGLGALCMAAAWRRLRWKGRSLVERWPVRRAAACAALVVAWLYCLLAGWEVPAQRTFMMLAVVAGAQALQLRLTGSRVLSLAAVVVLALDPWAVLASGFWLSFMAVAVLLAVGIDGSAIRPTATEPAAAVGRFTRILHGLKLAARLQWGVTWALAPALAWLFHEISLVSPFANAYGIPVIEMVVTPISLLLAAAALVPGLHAVATGLATVAHTALTWMMQPTEWLASLPTISVPAGPAWLYLLACVGAGVALWPRRGGQHSGPARTCLRYRAWAWLALLPMAFWRPATPAEGEWDLYALDVGQGSALLVRTSRHAVLFDAGARHARDSDEGARTIVPALRALGLQRLDALVVSHADLDHAGGVRSVLAGAQVEQTFSSFDLVHWSARESRQLEAPDTPSALAMSPCVAGSHWRIDGVSFEFLWPLDVQAVRPSRQANNASCVLRVRGAHHSVLLTGDIEAAAEARLVERGLTPVDVVVAAHHGSRTSSSAAFVNAVAARHVIMQVGRWNRHGHPNEAVLSRWERAGAAIWRTDWQGGVNAQSRAKGLTMYSVLESSRRYWHGRRP